MDRGELKQMLLDRYQKTANDSKFVAELNNAVHRVMEKISLRRNWWFMQDTASVTMIADQLNYIIGNPQPISTAQASDSGNPGNPTGTYQYRITYVNAFGESNPSAKTAAVTVATNQITLSNIPLAPAAAGVTGKRIYRNTTAGSTWYLVGTVGDNVTITWTDNVTDATLVAANSLLPFQHIVRPLSYMWHLGGASDDDVTVRRVSQERFRKLVPDTSRDTGDPSFVVQNGSILQMYPRPTQSLVVTYPYFYKFRRLAYDTDMIPEEIPDSLLFHGMDMACTRYLNKENRWFQQAQILFERELDELENEHIRQTPSIEVVSEDEDVGDFMAQFPRQDFYRE